MMFRIGVAGLLLAACMSTQMFSQGKPSGEDQKAKAGGDLAAEARDPTGSILAFITRFDQIASFHNISGVTRSALVLQPIIPHRLGGPKQIARITMPIVVGNSPAGKTGLADLVAVNIFLNNLPNGRWGLGPVIVVPLSSDPSLGAGNWELGPAGVVILKNGPLQWGGLMQFVFSIGQKSGRSRVNPALAFQPFAAIGLPDSWGIGLSEVSFNYDLKDGRWTSLPLGLNIDKLVVIGGQPIRLFVQGEYNFVSTGVTPQFTVRFGVTPLFPL